MAITTARDSDPEQAALIHPFRVDVPPADIDDLLARIAATR